jgi:hypothetical protein
MMAIKSGNPQTVEFLLSFDHAVTNASLLIRDVNGSLPIHEATSRGYEKIVQLLLGSTSPQMMTAMFTENGVGSTPLEIATFKYLLASDAELQTRFNSNAVQFTTPSSLIVNNLRMPWTNARTSLDTLKGTLEQLSQINQTTVDQHQALANIVVSLDQEGRLANSPDLRRVLKEYVESNARALEVSNTTSKQKKQIDEELKALYASAEESSATNNLQAIVSPGYGLLGSASFGLFNTRVPFPNQGLVQAVESMNVKATYNAIKNAVESSGLRRRRGLVHLLDAQTAVNAALDVATNQDNSLVYSFGQSRGYYNSYRLRRRIFANMEGLGPEEDQNKYNYILDYSMTCVDIN